MNKFTYYVICEGFGDITFLNETVKFLALRMIQETQPWSRNPIKKYFKYNISSELRNRNGLI